VLLLVETLKNESVGPAAYRRLARLADGTARLGAISETGTWWAPGNSCYNPNDPDPLGAAVSGNFFDTLLVTREFFPKETG